MAALTLKSVRKSFGSTEVIRDVNFTVGDGEFVVFVGPSGCGKSTLLRLIAGLEKLSSGAVLIDGEDVSARDPSKRGIAMVFQSYALYPHMTVEENMAFGLEMAGVPPQKRKEMVAAAAETLHLTPYLQRKPKALSGGQRQRVAIGRAIVRDPKIFLFDEPLSNLDAELRVRMRMEIAKLHRDLGVTMIYVTHDQVEAMTLATRIVVLNGGIVEQIGSPLELYRDPDNLFVAGFLGSPKMNFLKARIITGESSGRVEVAVPDLGLERLPVAVRGAASAIGDEVTLGIRPEQFRDVTGRHVTLTLRADAVEHLGDVSYVHAVLGQATLIAEVRDADVAVGDQVQREIRPEDCVLFSATGARL